MNSSTEEKSLSSRSGARLAASAAKPEASAAELRRKLRRFIGASGGIRRVVDGEGISVTFWFLVRLLTIGTKRMRARRRLLRREFRRVRVVAGHAVLALECSDGARPHSADAPVRAGFPIAQGRAVATTAKRGTIEDFQLAAVAGLEQFEIRLVVAVETNVVPVVPAVFQREVLVRLGEDDVLLGVEVQHDGLFLVVARVATKARSIAARAFHLRAGHTDSCGVGELGISEGNRREDRWPAPQVEKKRADQPGVAKRQPRQHEPFLAVGTHNFGRSIGCAWLEN